MYDITNLKKGGNIKYISILDNIELCKKIIESMPKNYKIEQMLSTIENLKEKINKIKIENIFKNNRIDESTTLKNFLS